MHAFDPSVGCQLCSAARPAANVTVCLEELSEEDQQLKSELEMLVERLKVVIGEPCPPYVER